jgi:AraC-like DNA-binding protein
VKSNRSASSTVRLGLVAAIPEVLASLGADPAEVLGEIRLEPKLFDDPEHRISYLARGRLLAHCAQRSGCAHFGLLVGQRASLRSFGLIGLLARSAPDAGRALRSLVRHFHYQARGAVLALEVDGDLAELSYASYQPRAVATDQVGDGAIAIAFNLLHDLCGPDWAPIELRFAHHRPDDMAPFRRFFKAPLRFDAEQYAVVFSASWLVRALPGTDPELRRLLQEQIDRLEHQHEDDFAEQVRSMLRHALVSGHAGAEQIAALFAMDRRTLNRRLNAQGTGFQQIVDEVSFEIARQLLTDSAIGIVEVADLLGYANASAFTRAFRRWSGGTPAAWREQAKPDTLLYGDETRAADVTSGAKQSIQMTPSLHRVKIQ